MKDRPINKLGILMLAVIFLLSMASYSIAQGITVQGKAKKPPKPPELPELYKVTIIINNDGPGIETLGCESVGYFYAERLSDRNLILNLESKGSDTPGPNGDEVAPLNMLVMTGIDDPIWLENCYFSDGCHGETDDSPGKIFIRILQTYDGDGPNEDIQIRWWADFENVIVNVGKKKEKITQAGWNIYSLMYDEGHYLGQYIISTNPNAPDELAPPEAPGLPGDTWVTNVIGPFVLHHDGIACDGAPEDMWNRQVLPGFNIQLTIERVR